MPTQTIATGDSAIMEERLASSTRVAQALSVVDELRCLDICSAIPLLRLTSRVPDPPSRMTFFLHTPSPPPTLQ